jgi:hypothetical protein
VIRETRRRWISPAARPFRLPRRSHWRPPEVLASGAAIITAVLGRRTRGLPTALGPPGHRAACRLTEHPLSGPGAQLIFPIGRSLEADQAPDQGVVSGVSRIRVGTSEKCIEPMFHPSEPALGDVYARLPEPWSADRHQQSRDRCPSGGQVVEALPDQVSARPRFVSHRTHPHHGLYGGRYSSTCRMTATR